MSPEKEKRKVLCLMSGGLDSLLAVCLLKDQGLEIGGVVFESPFFGPENARIGAQKLGIPLTVLDFTQDSIELLNNPKHGFGSCMNPCIDCHARMLKRVGDLLPEMGGDFLATGEVLNERPMSQTRRSLEIVAGESGYADLILRPLSAQRLPPTRPEEMGWVDRNRLLGLEGRSRKPQFELAKKFGIESYPTPAGGCKLTEPNFCIRLRDLKKHEGIGDVRLLVLLRHGRHFRLPSGIKIIVGRDAGDNAALEKIGGSDDFLLKCEGIPGPVVLAPATASDADLLKAAEFCASYSDSSASAAVKVGIKGHSGSRIVETKPGDRQEIDRLRI
jgi:tRNA-uridine 2-sulfurtransferase